MAETTLTNEEVLAVIGRLYLDTIALRQDRAVLVAEVVKLRVPAAPPVTPIAPVADTPAAPARARRDPKKGRT